MGTVTVLGQLEKSYVSGNTADLTKRQPTLIFFSFAVFPKVQGLKKSIENLQIIA